MMCCAGLIGGLALGQVLGGPWLIVGPALGFGLGLFGDIKTMRKMGRQKTSPDKEHGSSSFSQNLGMPCCASVQPEKETNARAQEAAEKQQGEPPREHELIIQLDTRLIQNPHPQHRHRNPQSAQENPHAEYAS